MKSLHLGFLLIFLCAVLFIHFFHTEHTAQEDDNCPACTFQKSSLAVSHIQFFLLVLLVLAVFLRFFPSRDYEYLYEKDFSARSPPHF